MTLSQWLVRGGFAAFLLGGATLTIIYGLPAARSDAAALSARWEITQWREGKVRMPGAAAWGKIRQQLLDARDITPDNAQIYDDLGFIHALRAQSVMGIPELKDLYLALLSESEEYYRTAVKLRPMFPYSWAHLALTLHYLDKRDAGFWRAYDTAFLYGKNEAGVVRILGEVAFANWASLGPERERAMRNLVETASPHVKQDLLAMATSQGILLDISVTP